MNGLTIISSLPSSQLRFVPRRTDLTDPVIGVTLEVDGWLVTDARVLGVAPRPANA